MYRREVENLHQIHTEENSHITLKYSSQQARHSGVWIGLTNVSVRL